MREADDVAMARGFFGYGRWEAPYWFLGPEQGKGPGEGPENDARVAAWVKLGKPEVCDCYQYHSEIRDLRWHTGMPPLQWTWRPLMLFLLAYLGRSTGNEALRAYQRDRWGRIKGETCVIELSAHAARSLATPSNRLAFRQERIETIRERIARHGPKLVLMYGKHSDEWARVADGPLHPDTFERRGATIFVQAPAPTSHGRKNEDWTSLAESIRRQHATFSSLPNSPLN